MLQSRSPDEISQSERSVVVFILEMNTSAKSKNLANTVSGRCCSWECHLFKPKSKKHFGVCPKSLLRCEHGLTPSPTPNPTPSTHLHARRAPDNAPGVPLCRSWPFPILALNFHKRFLLPFQWHCPSPHGSNVGHTSSSRKGPQD